MRQVPRGPDTDERRAPYEVTASGLAAFDQWFAEIPRATAPSDSEFALRARFFADVDPSRIRTVIDSWRADLGSLSKVLERELRRPVDNVAYRPAYDYVLRCRLRQVAAEIELLDGLQEAFVTGRPQPSVRATLESSEQPHMPRPVLDAQSSP